MFSKLLLVSIFLVCVFYSCANNPVQPYSSENNASFIVIETENNQERLEWDERDTITFSPATYNYSVMYCYDKSDKMWKQTDYYRIDFEKGFFYPVTNNAMLNAGKFKLLLFK